VKNRLGKSAVLRVQGKTWLKSSWKLRTDVLRSRFLMIEALKKSLVMIRMVSPRNGY
jgi:hypothetical protein